MIFPYNENTIFSHHNGSCRRRKVNMTIVTENTIDFEIKSKNKITSKDKVYISKFSSFPSLSLSRIENIDIFRTINADKSDKIVVDTNYTYKLVDEDYFYCEFTNKNNENDKICCIFKENHWCNINYLNSLSIYKNVDLTSYQLTYHAKCNTYDINFELVSILLQYSYKLVSTQELNKYVDNFLPKLDNEIYDMIEMMLLGNDRESIKLGVNLLANYDFSDMIIKVMTLLKQCFSRVVNIKHHNSTAFAHLCYKCGLSKFDLEYANYLDFNLRIYNSVKSLEDKLLIKDNIRKYIENEVKTSYNQYLDHTNLTIRVN